MCGLFGCYVNNNAAYLDDAKFLSLLKKIRYRGPDNTGFKRFQINNNNLFFGHQRLSIQDVNPRSNQPMESKDNRYSIIFNGEIYNHLELRTKLNNIKKIAWVGTSDTETLLELFNHYPISKFLDFLNGMFSFAVLDRKKNKIFLARDRLGEKPLYIYTNNSYFAFCSDLRALKGLPNFQKIISKKATQLYLKFNYIPAPDTIYENTFKLPQGSYIELDLNKYNFNLNKNFNQLIHNENTYFKKYWNITENKKENHYDNNYIKNTEFLLSKSINRQLISDVKVGAFLSGGVDSSIIVSMMQKVQKTNTYTLGFDNEKYDESIDAKKISNILGTNHNEFICNEKDLLDFIPSLPNAYSEPFADSSQIPTLIVSKIASEEVKVILSGDGGDELFGGYNRYIFVNKYWKLLQLLPQFITSNPDKFFKIFPKKFLIYLLDLFKLDKYSMNSKKEMINNIKNKLSKTTNQYSFYNSLTSQFEINDPIFNFKLNLENSDKYFINHSDNFVENMMVTDLNYYLADDILCKVDRASMYFSLEVRSPFLDKDLVEYAINIPTNQKINKNNSKYITKKILEKYLPAELIYKKKKGFAVPISKWINGNLRNWVEEVLSKKNLEKHNYFNYEKVKKLKEDHYNDVCNNEHKLWSIIQFNQWYENYF